MLPLLSGCVNSSTGLRKNSLFGVSFHRCLRAVLKMRFPGIVLILVLLLDSRPIFENETRRISRSGFKTRSESVAVELEMVSNRHQHGVADVLIASVGGLAGGGRRAA